MSETKRVIFSFDERSLESIEKMIEQGRYPSMSGAIQHSCAICRAVIGMSAQGFTELIARNPETNEERVVIIPTLFPPSYSK